MSTVEKRMKKMSNFGVLLLPLVGGLWLVDNNRPLYFISWIVLGFMFGWMMALGIIDYWIRKEKTRSVLGEAEKDVVGFLKENISKVTTRNS